jgi:uncharacterized protein (DUF362 family)
LREIYFFSDHIIEPKLNDRGITLTPKVAAIEFDESGTTALKRALDLIGGIDFLNSAEKPVVIKVGVFDSKMENHISVDLLTAVVSTFDKPPKVLITESDNYKGSGSERLQIWKQIYSERIVPFNLSDDPETKKVNIAGKEMGLSHILFKPRVLVDTHILRSFEKGSVLKNLFGCIPDTHRVKYHNILPSLLGDVYEAIGGIDLAIIDGTFLWRGAGDAPVRMNTILVGRDAVAVEVVGATLAGLNIQKMPVIQEFVRRGLGEGNLDNIEVVGASFDHLAKKFKSARKSQKKEKSTGAQTWGGRANRIFRDLTGQGYFERANGRTIEDVIKTLETRGLQTVGNEDRIQGFMTRRIKKGIFKKARVSNEWVYWKE